jgi:cytochrome P450
MSEDAKVDDLKIKKGTNVSIFTYSIHRDERYYPEPEKFDPDRFLPENSRNRHAFAYLPFSVGKRNCIGQRFAMMEEKILLASILRRFEVTSLMTTEELEPTAEIVLKPKNGVPLKLTLRSKC